MFAESTQARFYVFTEEGLAHSRHDAVIRTQKSFPLTCSERDQIRYVRYYGDCLLLYADQLELCLHHKYGALALYQRVFALRTIWEMQPINAMMACLLLFWKFDVPRPLDEMLIRLGYGDDFPADMVSKAEMEVLYTLEFRLKVHLPFRPLEALCSELPNNVHTAAAQVCCRFLRTDALLMFTPAMIAMTALAEVIGPEAARAAAGRSDLPIANILALDDVAMSRDEAMALEQQIKPDIAASQILQDARAKVEKSKRAPRVAVV